MERRGFISFGAAYGLALFTPLVHAMGSLSVIAHVGTNARCLSADELFAMFTLSKQQWDNGQRVIPFNFPPKHELRVQVDRAILKMSPEESAKYWIDQRIRGGGAPPRHVPSAALMARVIQQLPGSIGYLPSTLVPTGVRVVAEVVGASYAATTGCK
jgi:hypothetical protein